MKRLTNEQWKDVFNKLEKSSSNKKNDNGMAVLQEVAENDSIHWCLYYEKELLEDDFETKEDVLKRLENMTKMYLNTKF